MSILDQTTLSKLDEFRVGVAALPNESAKTHAFMALVAQLFPATDVVARLAGGIEKRVRIEAGDRRIDSYFNNAVIEFERDLDVSLDTAVAQLHEQAAGLWNGAEDPDRGLLCVASDGLRWETYRATLGSPAPAGKKLGPENVRLEPLQSFKLTPGSLSTFWLWLTGLLFRDNQVLPDAERFRLDFGSSGPAYLDGIRQLRAAWAEVGGEGEAKVAFEAWRRYLAVTYGQLADSGQEIASPETVDLFLKHTFLAMIARLLVWAALSKGRAEAGLSAAIERALDGSYFRERKIENLVESDFFQWATADRPAAVLRPAWERALGLILSYDLSRLSQDVLKGVYQELVDPRDRHDLGEYYTPEWLCTRIVAEMMPESGVVSVLDPTCGSGSFLRAAIAHMVDHNPSMDKGELLAAILEGVVGIDIHPLAVTIAKATYLLALKDLMATASRPIRIPVYLADALFLPAEVSQSLLNGREIEVRFGLDRDRKFFLPSKILDEPGRFDEAISIGATVAENLARGGAGDDKVAPADASARARLIDFGRRIQGAGGVSLGLCRRPRLVDPRSAELDLGVYHQERLSAGVAERPIRPDPRQPALALVSLHLGPRLSSRGQESRRRLRHRAARAEIVHAHGAGDHLPDPLAGDVWQNGREARVRHAAQRPDRRPT